MNIKFALAALLFGGNLFAQTPADSMTVRGEELYSPFQFSFCYPLGTNGTNARLYTNGASVNLLVGVSKNEEHFALAGISNIISGYAKGVQIASIHNYIGEDGKGLLLAGLANRTADYQGVQIGGLLNIAQNVNGLQVGGLMNIAKKVRGVQFATLLNIAEESDFPIGLVNIIKKGRKGIGLTYDILGNTIVSFRSGGKYTYGILGIGFNHKVVRDDKLVTEAGYGIHIPVCRWMQIDNELKVASIGAISDDSYMNLSYLLAPSFTLANHYNIFGGMSLNYFNSQAAEPEALLPNAHLWSKDSGDRIQRIYIGYQVGVQYLF